MVFTAESYSEINYFIQNQKKNLHHVYSERIKYYFLNS